MGEVATTPLPLDESSSNSRGSNFISSRQIVVDAVNLDLDALSDALYRSRIDDELETAEDETLPDVQQQQQQPTEQQPPQQSLADADGTIPFPAAEDVKPFSLEAIPWSTSEQFKPSGSASTRPRSETISAAATRTAHMVLRKRLTSYMDDMPPLSPLPNLPLPKPSSATLPTSPGATSSLSPRIDLVDETGSILPSESNLQRSKSDFEIERTASITSITSVNSVDQSSDQAMFERKDSIAGSPPKRKKTTKVSSKILPGETPKQCLKRIMQTKDLKLLGEYFGLKGEFFGTMLDLFLDEYNFVGVSIDYALRQFLAGFVLPVESQQIDRIMLKFANRYHNTNPAMFSHPDTAYVLSFSVIMLNTDLHNPSVKSRMTKQQFFKNNRGIDRGKDLPEKLLERIYDSIRNEQIRYPGDEVEPEENFLVSEQSLLTRAANLSGSITDSIIRKFPKRNSNGGDIGPFFTGRFAARRTSGHITPTTFTPPTSPTAVSSSSTIQSPTFLNSNSSWVDVVLEEDEHQLKKADSAPELGILGNSTSAEGVMSSFSASSVEHKQTPDLPLNPSFVFGSELHREGLLCKKNDLEEDGKRALKRTWKLFHVFLKGPQLLLYASDALNAPPTTKTPSVANPIISPTRKQPIQTISLLNAFCFVEYGHRQRAHVFRLITAKKAAYLFQGVSVNDVTLWINEINKSAATYTVFSHSGEMHSAQGKMAAVRSKIKELERKVQIEIAYRDGIAKIADGHKSFANPSAEAQALSKYSGWERGLQELSNDLRKYRCYADILKVIVQKEQGGSSPDVQMATVLQQQEQSHMPVLQQEQSHMPSSSSSSSSASSSSSDKNLR